MHSWITLTIVVGVFVVVIQVLLFIVLFIKFKKGNVDISTYDFPTKRKRRRRRRRMVSKGITFVDPYTGGTMGLEKVGSIDSLRSSRSVGFIEYQRSDVSTISGPTSSMISGRDTPNFGGSINDGKSVSSMPPLSTIFIDEERATRTNFNPIYEEDVWQMDNESVKVAAGEQLTGGHIKLRAKEVKTPSLENEGITYTKNNS